MPDPTLEQLSYPKPAGLEEENYSIPTITIDSYIYSVQGPLTITPEVVEVDKLDKFGLPADQAILCGRLTVSGTIELSAVAATAGVAPIPGNTFVVKFNGADYTVRLVNVGKVRNAGAVATCSITARTDGAVKVTMPAYVAPED